MLGGIGAQEIMLIFLVVLLLFGAKRIPEIGSALGKGIREFKSSVREIEGEFKNPPKEREQLPPRAAPAPPTSQPQNTEVGQAADAGTETQARSES